MELTVVSRYLDNIFDACRAHQPAEIDLFDMQHWRATLLELNSLLAKKGEEYNFVKTIILSYEHFVESLPKINSSYDELSEIERNNFIIAIEDGYAVMLSRLKQLRFNLSFYEKFGYFNNNVVAVGANGSGKTSLADNLRSSLNNNGLVISAQRVLFIPELDNIPNPQLSQERWVDMNQKSRTFKNIGDFLQIKEEFGFVLENLIAKHCSYAIDMLDSPKGGTRPPSELETTLLIWNNVFEHRKLKLVQGIKLKVFFNDKSYEPIRLSEGEKSALYLVSQVVQAPIKGFIIIDEPEMYLHKTIISKIWDMLERERDDCTFIYLTHDLDFAVSRNTAAKVWLKSFSYPNDWDIKSIPKNDIPEKLMLELLGSRKNILFCEGTKGSIDQSIYEMLLPDYTIIPVEGCMNVINFTKAYNKIPHLNTKAFGIIDSDHHSSERLEKLRDKNVYNIKLAEVENLFLEEKLLNLVAERLFNNRVAQIKSDIIKELDKEKEIQASRFITNKINNIFNDTHVVKANNAEEIEENLSNFNAKIEIKKWYEERIVYIDSIVLGQNYKEVISIFNNKGLKAIVERHFGKKDYTGFVMQLVRANPDALKIVRNLLPKELIE
ncbi:ABC transporter ATP-binding protein [Pedobacter sp. KBW01]|uniref:AAA family ATPase n=1 Tax=Pedobacter sp. KBW01 TaxID=2153364 RepID=UPI000F5A2610|nr:AAA family ATPase [Pedobacter sp. KBW01]RQO78471.1 ABC transporter ATP-binding protein [Pedobacter sp. KBW01]